MAVQAGSVVLVVSGRAELLQLFRASLAAPLEVVTAASAAEALLILQKEPDRFDGVCADLSLKDGNGADFLRKLDADQSAATGILVTTYQAYSGVSRDSGTSDRFFLLFEPFMPDQLRELVSRAAQTAAMRRQMRKLRTMRVPASK